MAHIAMYFYKTLRYTEVIRVFKKPRFYTPDLHYSAYFALAHCLFGHNVAHPSYSP